MKVGVIGLGYVGLPLIIELSKKFETVGYDFRFKRMIEINNGFDKTLQVSSEVLKNLPPTLKIASDPDILEDVNFFIVCVPTPIDDGNKPDLRLLEEACKTVSKYLKPKDIVVFESTVYPGCTENFCVPILESESGLEFNKDFAVGFSPERINPGDKVNTLPNVVKIVAGSSDSSLDIITDIYGAIIPAGIHIAQSILIAESAKIIENVQRDVNIALMNDLKILFDKLDINFGQVLEAANTKWNFLNFTPGIVGGHCIGVDPYYLLFKAHQNDVDLKLVTTSRAINEQMPRYYTDRFLKILKGKEPKSILVLGFTFKENCPDPRNSKVQNIVDQLVSYNHEVLICDPYLNSFYDEQFKKYSFLEFSKIFDEVNMQVKSEYISKFDGVMVAVSHKEFVCMREELPNLLAQNGVLFELKDTMKK
jgi:UDP-N-acetyl-D-galactosamine dehydrogenase